MRANNRHTINVESAKILEHKTFAGNQYLLRLQAPETAKTAKPGSFIHMVCNPELPMRRPMSIMRANDDNGWIEILYKAHGHGTRLLASRQVGEYINLMGPIGIPFKLDHYQKQPLLIGGGVGIPPILFLAEHIKRHVAGTVPLVFMGSEVPFPFTTKPSQIMIPGIPQGTIATMPLLEDWGIPCRLTSLQDFAGCYTGYVTDLAREWLEKLDVKARTDVEIFSCGPTPMLKAVAKLAHDFNLPCQVSLEEFMACAVGGCAGCTVAVKKGQDLTMQRVCVDGPVFEANSVFPA